MEPKTIISHKEFDLKDFFFQWEWMLMVIFIIVNIINMILSRKRFTGCDQYLLGQSLYRTADGLYSYSGRY